jgi:Domain of unknown function (DUF4781)/Domain of unknown function (DUF4157)/Adenosine deaminase
MDYIQGDPNYQEPDYYSYNPETEESAQDPSVYIDPVTGAMRRIDPVTGYFLHSDPITGQLLDNNNPILGKASNVHSPERKPRKRWSLLEQWYPDLSDADPEQAIHPDLAEHVGSAFDSEERDADRTAEQLTTSAPASGKAAEKTVEKTAEKALDKATEKAAEKTVEKIPGKSVAKVPEQAIEKVSTKPAEPPKIEAKPELAALDKTSELDPHATAGQSLPDELIKNWEPQLGHSLKDVKIVSDDKSDKANKTLGSRAFNVGKHIYFGAGEYNPGTPEGKKLIAHEVGHLKQPGKKIRRKASGDDHLAKIAAQKARQAELIRQEQERQAAIQREKARQAAIRQERERKAAQQRSQDLKLAAQRAREKTRAQQTAQAKEQHPHQSHPAQDKNHPVQDKQHPTHQSGVAHTAAKVQPDPSNHSKPQPAQPKFAVTPQEQQRFDKAHQAQQDSDNIFRAQPANAEKVPLKLDGKTDHYGQWLNAAKGLTGAGDKKGTEQYFKDNERTLKTLDWLLHAKVNPDVQTQSSELNQPIRTGRYSAKENNQNHYTTHFKDYLAAPQNPNEKVSVLALQKGSIKALSGTDPVQDVELVRAVSKPTANGQMATQYYTKGEGDKGWIPLKGVPADLVIVNVAANGTQAKPQEKTQDKSNPAKPGSKPSSTAAEPQTVDSVVNISGAEQYTRKRYNTIQQNYDTYANAPFVAQQQLVGDKPKTLNGSSLRNEIGSSLFSNGRIPQTEAERATQTAGEWEQFPKAPQEGLTKEQAAAQRQQAEKLDKIENAIREKGGDTPKVTKLPILVDSPEAGQVVELPLFRVQGKDGKDYFVDDHGRTYNDMADWKANNKLPSGKVTYFEDGHVSSTPDGKPKTVTEATHAVPDTLGEQAKGVADKVMPWFGAALGVVAVTTLVLATIGTGGAALPLLLAAAPYVTAGIIATSAYGAASSGSNLYDRYSHGQSIGLEDEEARGEWLNLGASSLGVAGAGFSLAGKGVAAASAATKVAGSADEAVSAVGAASKVGSEAQALNGLSKTGEVLGKASDVADVAGMGDSAHSLVTHWDEMTPQQRAEGLGQTVMFSGMMAAPRIAGLRSPRVHTPQVAMDAPDAVQPESQSQTRSPFLTEQQTPAMEQRNLTTVGKGTDASPEMGDRDSAKPSIEEAIALRQQGDTEQAAAVLKQVKQDLSPDEFAAAKQDYLQAAKEPKEAEPKLGEDFRQSEHMGRNVSKTEYKKQQRIERLHPGNQHECDCAPMAVQQIIKQNTGVHLSEAEVVSLVNDPRRLAEVIGYDPEDGITPRQVQKPLNYMGVEATSGHNTPEFIQAALEEGKGVVTSHDAGLLWNLPEEYKPSGEKVDYGGHALSVLGLVKNDQGQVTHYVVNDTHKDYGGRGKHIPADEFEASLLAEEIGEDQEIKKLATFTENPVGFDLESKEYALWKRENIHQYMREKPEVVKDFKTYGLMKEDDTSYLRSVDLKSEAETQQVNPQDPVQEQPKTQDDKVEGTTDKEQDPVQEQAKIQDDKAKTESQDPVQEKLKTQDDKVTAKEQEPVQEQPKAQDEKLTPESQDKVQEEPQTQHEKVAVKAQDKVQEQSEPNLDEEGRYAELHNHFNGVSTPEQLVSLSHDGDYDAAMNDVLRKKYDLGQADLTAIPHTYEASLQSLEVLDAEIAAAEVQAKDLQSTNAEGLKIGEQFKEITKLKKARSDAEKDHRRGIQRQFDDLNKLKEFLNPYGGKVNEEGQIVFDSPEKSKNLTDQLLSIKPREAGASDGSVAFNESYDLRRVLLKKIKADGKQEEYVTSVLHELKKRNKVDYAELQGSLPEGVTYEDLQRLMKKEGIHVNFLAIASSDKTLGKQTAGVSDAEVRLLESKLAQVGTEGVVGMDIAGKEAKFTDSGMDYFKVMYQKMVERSKALGDSKLVFRIHVGEGFGSEAEHPSYARENVTKLLDTIEEMKTLKDADGNPLLSDKVVLRLGHITHASDSDLARIARLKESGVNIWTEANPTSNINTGAVKSEEAAHQNLLRSLLHKVVPTINTDGGGMMNTDLPEEYKLSRNALGGFKDKGNPIILDSSTGSTEKVMYFWGDKVTRQQQQRAEEAGGYEARVLPDGMQKYFETSIFKRESDRYRKDVAPELSF